MIDQYHQENFDLILVLLLFIGGQVGYFVGVYRKRRGCITFENTGEALVRNLLKGYCQGKEAHLLNGVTLRLTDGSTTQIDHILISTKGIFVIETKHYKGWIFANPQQKEWTQVLLRNRYKFQNPIRQNYKHVKEVQRVLEFIEPRFIHNIVVFTGESIFKTPSINHVCKIEELIPTLEKYSKSVLSINRVYFCVGRLEYLRLELSRKTDIEHQMYLNRKYG